MTALLTEEIIPRCQQVDWTHDVPAPTTQVLRRVQAHLCPQADCDEIELAILGASLGG